MGWKILQEERREKGLEVSANCTPRSRNYEVPINIIAKYVPLGMMPHDTHPLFGETTKLPLFCRFIPKNQTFDKRECSFKSGMGRKIFQKKYLGALNWDPKVFLNTATSTIVHIIDSASQPGYMKFHINISRDFRSKLQNFPGRAYPRNPLVDLDLGSGTISVVAPGEGYSPPSEHASPASQMKSDFFGDFWHL